MKERETEKTRKSWARAAGSKSREKPEDFCLVLLASTSPCAWRFAPHPSPPASMAQGGRQAKWTLVCSPAHRGGSEAIQVDTASISGLSSRAGPQGSGLCLLTPGLPEAGDWPREPLEGVDCTMLL